MTSEVYRTGVCSVNIVSRQRQTGERKRELQDTSEFEGVRHQRKPEQFQTCLNLPQLAVVSDELGTGGLAQSAAAGSKSHPTVGGKQSTVITAERACQRVSHMYCLHVTAPCLSLSSYPVFVISSRCLQGVESPAGNAGLILRCVKMFAAQY